MRDQSHWRDDSIVKYNSKICIKFLLRSHCIKSWFGLICFFPFSMALFSFKTLVKFGGQKYSGVSKKKPLSIISRTKWRLYERFGYPSGTQCACSTSYIGDMIMLRKTISWGILDNYILELEISLETILSSISWTLFFGQDTAYTSYLLGISTP